MLRTIHIADLGCDRDIGVHDERASASFGFLLHRHL
jgi:hypothetical protein